jgi:hypothetical protein
MTGSVKWEIGKTDGGRNKVIWTGYPRVRTAKFCERVCETLNISSSIVEKVETHVSYSESPLARKRY